MPQVSTPRRIARANRLVLITAMIYEQKSMRIVDLANKFRVNRRTVMRDFRSLRDAGLHIVFFPEQATYRLLERNETAASLHAEVHD